MGLITILLLAVSLCFDSFAVSLSWGMCRRNCSRWALFRFALILAVFQGVMPLVGWLVAVHFRADIETFDHWIAFGLLLLLGGKMIWESFGEVRDTTEIKGRPLSLGRSLLLGFATSIDALVAGVAMAMLPLTLIETASQNANMLVAVMIIALVTLIASLIGLFLGRRSRGKLGERAELIGGIILILIGLKVLIEHLIGG